MGANVRDWLYVDDHARALGLMLARGRPGETYNVGGRNERTNLDVVRTICQIMDRLHPEGGPHERLITFVEDRPGHDRRYAIDATKLETELGWRAAETFETGIEKTVEWFLARRDWWEPLRARVYGGERLGLIRPDRCASSSPARTARWPGLCTRRVQTCPASSSAAGRGRTWT